MNNIKSLEFDMIRNILSNYASMKLNKEKIMNLDLITNKEALLEELNKTDEASRILSRYGRIIITELNDIYSSIDKACKGAILNIDELYDIKLSFSIIKENKNFSKNINQEEFKSFFSLINYLSICPEINNSLIKTLYINTSLIK